MFMDKNEPVIIVEHTFEVTKERLWDAITDLNQMRQWFFENIPDFKAEIGFTTQFNVLSETRNFFHLWRITEVEPFWKIVYNWSYQGYDGEALVYFELFENGDRTTLKLTNKIIENFPNDIPEFTRKSGIDGWNYFIKGRLADFLKNK